jgi:hypothetical protein
MHANKNSCVAILVEVDGWLLFAAMHRGLHYAFYARPHGALGIQWTIEH